MFSKQKPATASHTPVKLGKRNRDGDVIRTADNASAESKQSEDEKMECQSFEQVSGQRTLTGQGFIRNTEGKRLLFTKKSGRHPKSLLKDETLECRALEGKDTIFDIIMPWVAEKAEEEEKKNPKQKKKTAKQQTLASFVPGMKKDGKARISNKSQEEPEIDEEE